MAPVAEKAKAAPARKTRFDLTERERLRAALLRYMEAHRIGVPTLQVRIAEAADRSVDLIPLKTLQRFLAGAARTNDAFLIPCHQFASALPDYGGPTEVTPDEFARALEGFFRLPETGLQGTKRPAIGLGSAYRVFAGRRGLRLAGSGQQEFPVPYAGLTVAARKSGLGAVSITEDVYNPGRVFPFEQADGQPRHRYEGALLRLEPFIFAVMRNLVTRLPKAYRLFPTGRRDLLGHGLEPPFAIPGMTDDPLRFFFEQDVKESSS